MSDKDEIRRYWVEDDGTVSGPAVAVVGDLHGREEGRKDGDCPFFCLEASLCLCACLGLARLGGFDMFYV